MSRFEKLQEDLKALQQELYALRNGKSEGGGAGKKAEHRDFIQDGIDSALESLEGVVEDA